MDLGPTSSPRRLMRVECVCADARAPLSMQLRANWKGSGRVYKGVKRAVSASCHAIASCHMCGMGRTGVDVSDSHQRERASAVTRGAPDGTPLRPAHYPKHREAKYDGKNRNQNQAHDCPCRQARRRDRQGGRRRSNRCSGESRDRSCAGQDQRGACRGPRNAHAIDPGDQARRRENSAAKPRQAGS